MRNNSDESRKIFEMWSDPEYYKTQPWYEINLEIQGRMTFSRMRTGELYAVAHTKNGEIVYSDCSKGKCCGFNAVCVQNANSHKAIGTVYMVDFADGRIAWFAASENHGLLCSVSDKIGSPINWEIIGAGVFGKPYPLARSYGGIQIFVRDILNGVSHRWYTDEGWSDWECLYGHIAGNINSVDNVNDLPVLLVRGPENAVWGKEHLVPNGWGEWRCLGGRFREDPVALRDDDKKIWAFAVDFENRINAARVLPDASLESAWQQLDGLVAGSPACAYASGTPVLVAISPEGGVIMRRYREMWGEWTHIGLNGIEHVDVKSDGDIITILAQNRAGRVFVRQMQVK